MQAAYGIFHSIIGIVMLVVYIGSLCWIYSDAEENHGMGCIWVVIGMLFWPISLLIYAILFRGPNVVGQHRGPRREDDLRFRSMYRADTNGNPEPQSRSGDWGGKVPMQSKAKADAEFRDETLDRLLSDGKLSEARTYLKDMQKLAREMGDSKGVANYATYESRISIAASRTKKSGDHNFD